MNGEVQSSFLSRLWALMRKEFGQISHSRSLIISLIIPPTLQIILFGFALNPTVNHLRLGVVDECRDRESRDLIDAFTANGAFVVAHDYLAIGQMQQAMSRGDLDAGLLIPAHFARDRARKAGPVQVQFILNAMDANTAGIAEGYAGTILQAYNEDTMDVQTRSAPGTLGYAHLRARIALLYNPGLVSAWFIITGTFGILLILNGSLVAATTTSREKETGTLEQLLMTPAGTTEIIIAKMAPLFLLLMMDVGLVMVVGGLVFALPQRGSLPLILFAGACCCLVGIGIGTFIATFTRTGLQAKLLSFFVNPPMAMLSGATTPVEAMPKWLQPLTLLNPVRHFSLIARGVLIKGVGLEVLYPNLLALIAFAVILVTMSVVRYRKQLS
jgi:ABC-2 type transport system permease protein